ncbi:hypothetical protein BJX64DRAFT_298240 [Aspergillus heterothallicus]
MRTYSGPIDCDLAFEIRDLHGTTAIATGGANGLGEAYVRALTAAGVHVCIGDVDTKRGAELEQELPGSKFVQCNTASWDDQVRLFKEAAESSLTGRISYVPQKSSLDTIDVNINGALYTAKLAMHYFVKRNGQVPSPEQEDTCLVLIGSGAAFLDVPRAPQYAASKWAMRSLVNVISPWYVRTSILSKEMVDKDAGQCLIRILSDRTINGKSLFMTSKKWAVKGYLDLDLEDYDGIDFLQEAQEEQMRLAPLEAGLCV